MVGATGPGQSLRIAVTGGSGSIGRAVVSTLARRGHQVINIDRRNARENKLPNVRFVYADITRRDQIQPILEQVDAVAHLAEISHQHAPFSPDEIFAHNTRAAATVLQTAADLELRRAIYTSSVQVYGCWDHPLVPPLRLPFDETHPLQPQNVYALSKVANESYARWISGESGLSLAIFRLPFVLRFGGRYTEENWVHWMLRGDGGPIDGFGTYLHADDAAMAYALALERPSPGCCAYHFSAAEIASSRPLRERLSEHHPDFPPLPADWPDYRTPMILDKAERDFGWRPTWNLLERHRKRSETKTQPVKSVSSAR